MPMETSSDNGLKHFISAMTSQTADDSAHNERFKKKPDRGKTDMSQSPGEDY